MAMLIDDKADWNPSHPAILVNQRAGFDRMRERCPVAHSEAQGWTLFRHADVSRVLHDPETFSNAVSRHISVPNGMDPPEHTAYRRLIEPYFAESRVATLETDCRDTAKALLAQLPAHGKVELMADIARPYAGALQCAFLGWPATLAPRLVDWTLRNQQATRAHDRPRLEQLAARFHQLVTEILSSRREEGLRADDTTSRLLREQVSGRPLSDAEITSILRNWTVGEIGTLSAAIGIIVQALAHRPELQQHCRLEPEIRTRAIEEILRWHGPLVDNRRIATRPVTLGGRRLEAGERITLNWVAANRDPAVFTEPDTINPLRDQSDSLLWGAGPHVCPGAGLARLELRAFLDELLTNTKLISPDPDEPAERAVHPGSGWHRLPVELKRS